MRFTTSHPCRVARLQQLLSLVVWFATVCSGVFPLSRANAQAPTIVSVNPVDGAADVTADTPIEIAFDRDMDTSVFVISALGNLAMTPSNLSAQTQGSWSADKRVLTLRPTFGPWPINVSISWTLNPPGGLGLFLIKSSGGVALAPATGHFTTGLGAPVMGSVIPKDNDENVATNIAVAFRFNQAMKKIALPGGTPPAIRWTGTGLDVSKFLYTWSADSRTLTAAYLGGFPLKTRVDWVLNPAGAAVPFESTTGKALPVDTYHGGFNTTAFPLCNAVPQNPNWGSYGINIRSEFRQSSAADPVPEIKSDLTPAPNVFSAVIQSPAFGPAVTSGAIQLPSGSQIVLTNFGGFVSYFEVLNSEAAMETAYPAGTYALRFNQTGLPERVVSMTQAAGDVPPVPKLLNFAEAQAINPTQDFRLIWNGFTNADAQDLISIFLSNAESDVVFQAPNVCVPIALVPTDSSVLIPANTLTKDRTYSAELLFGKSFYASTNDFPEMSGYGFRLRATRLTVSTGTGPDPAPTLDAPEVQPDGKPTFSLQGAANRSYAIQRTDRLDSGIWTEAGSVMADSGGRARFIEIQPSASETVYYRAVAK